jgi:hypothetical protein
MGTVQNDESQTNSEASQNAISTIDEEDLVEQFVKACSNGNVDSFLSQAKILLQKTNTDGYSPLFASCMNGHTKVVRYLIDLGANIDEINGNGMSPIHIASKNGHLEVVQEIMKEDGGANAFQSNPQTWELPIHYAVDGRHRDIAEFFYNYYGEDFPILTLITKKGDNLLQFAAKSGCEWIFDITNLNIYEFDKKTIEALISLAAENFSLNFMYGIKDWSGIYSDSIPYEVQSYIINKNQIEKEGSFFVGGQNRISIGRQYESIILYLFVVIDK